MTNLALIGIGKWGQNYLHAADTLDKVEIKYICAHSQKTLKHLPNTYIKTTSIYDLLKDNQIDGFIIATPAVTHFTIAKQLLSFKKNFLIEKPLALTYKQALELQKIWQTQKTKVLVAHLYLYNPAYQEFKKLFNNMRKIKSIHFEGLCSPIRKDVSVIWDWGPHPISIFLDLIKKPIKKLNAFSPNKSLDTVKATLEFEDDIEALIDISWLGSHKVRRLIAVGDHTSLELDDTNINGQKVLLKKSNYPPQYPKYSFDFALTRELEEFIGAIKYNKQITSEINLGVDVVKILSGIEESVKSNGKSIFFR